MTIGAPPPVAVGVLGLGVAGRGALAALGRSAACRLVAIGDRNGALVEELAMRHGVRGHESAEELAADAEVEAVYVATPTFLRREHVATLVAAGKHLLIEKPLGRNGEEARAIAGLCRAGGRLAAAVNTRGRDPAIQQMARLVGSGDLGGVLSVLNVNYTPWILRPRERYELDTDEGGGVVYRQAPHQVEIVRELIDAPVAGIHAGVHFSQEPVRTVAGYNALISFCDGATASLVYNGFGFFDTAELTGGIGEGGVWREPGAGRRLRAVRAWSAEKYSPAGERARAIETSAGDAGEGAVGLSTYGLTIVSCQRGDIRQTPRGIVVYDEREIREELAPEGAAGLDADLEDFARALREGGALRHDAAWGAETAEICESIARAAAAEVQD